MNKRRVISVILVACLLVSSISMSFATDVKGKDTANTKAQALNKIGILAGDTKGNYNLSSSLKRGEAATFITKLMGKNDYVLQNKAKYINTGFSDVKPTDWFAPYVGYCKETSIVSGLGNNKFGPTQNVSEKAYLTMTMKSLGYTSEDFTWKNVYQKAFEIGLVTDESYKTKKEDNKKFTRADVVNAIDTSLNLKVKDTDTTLINKLVTDGVISKENAKEAGFKTENTLPAPTIPGKGSDNAGNNPSGSTGGNPGGNESTQLSFTLVQSSKTTVTMKFNKTIKANTFAGNKNVKLSHTTADVNTITAETAVSTSDNQTFVIDFGVLNPLPAGTTTTVYINYDSDSGTKIEDNDGNKLAATTFTVTTATEAPLDITSVTATNLRELVVTFNKAPNVDEAKKTANYAIKSSSTVNANPEQVTMSEDGKTVTLRTASANHMSNNATDIELTILKAVGFSADKVVKGIVAKDVTVPTVVSVKTTGPRDFKVTLSEPLDEAITPNDIAMSFKIDGGLIGIDSSSCTVSGLEISIKTYSDLTESSHKIEVVPASKLKDNAGYLLNATTITFDYVDTTPLTFNLVESSDSTVTIKFNKAIKTNTFAGNKNVKLSHTNADTNSISAETAVTTSDNQTFVIDFGTSNPIPQLPTTVYIKYDSESGTKIEANYGKKLAATSFIVKLTATAEFVDAQTVRVTYSKDVVNDGLINSSNNLSNYVLKSGTNVIQITHITYPIIGSKRIIELKTPVDALDGTAYTLNIKNVKDVSISANQIDEVTLNFTGTDKVAPNIKIADSKLVAPNKFKVVFTEAMDVASITDKTVYKLNGTILAADDMVVAIDSNKAVIITFKVAPAFSINNTLSVGMVKDVSGNWTKYFQMNLNFWGGVVAKVSLKEYQITGKNSIKLVVEDVINAISGSDFQYTTSAGAIYQNPTGITTNIVGGVTYIILSTSDLPSTTGGGIEVRTIGNTSSQNLYGSKLYFDTTQADGTTGIKAFTIFDKCPPRIVGTPTFTTQAAIKVGTTLESVNITYSENIYASSVTDNDYTIAGYEVSNVVVSGATVTVYVENVDSGTYTPGTVFSVTQVSDIEDMNRNMLGLQNGITFK